LRDEIVATIQVEGKLEAEIVESAAIQEAISDKISLIKSVLHSVTMLILNASAPAFVLSEDPTSTLLVVTSHREHASRLPKLHLLNFSGDPLSWQSFWDSFNAAVHSNPVLDDVQKFITFMLNCTMKLHMQYQVSSLAVETIKQYDTITRAFWGKPTRSFKLI